MSALTEIFNYILAYLVFFFSILFDLDSLEFDFSPEITDILIKISTDFMNTFPNLDVLKIPLSTPLLLLPVGIFVIGVVIGLCKRLMS